MSYCQLKSNLNRISGWGGASQLLLPAPLSLRVRTARFGLYLTMEDDYMIVKSTDSKKTVIDFFSPPRKD
jgi:hypothetical protein